ncbi:hypothetical protein TG4357_01952 [Thalassovita gelatinovora]|uniref:Uncharacterized protein n=1 Tax=Thalassovita gelatinovora TaxID=53501 RepID=A0A0P1FC00_THAGE|nr:hypothetical protein TG4357_01952 [Thalassovita gelatinovora]
MAANSRPAKDLNDAIGIETAGTAAIGKKPRGGIDLDVANVEDEPDFIRVANG